MDRRGRITTPFDNNVQGKVLLDGEKLIIYVVPSFVRMVFGAVGELISPTKKRMTLTVSEIKNATITKGRSGKITYGIETYGESFYEFVFHGENEFTDELTRMLRKTRLSIL